MRPEIKNYFTERYPRWLEYANYHADTNGMPGEGEELLNECLSQLLAKYTDEDIERMYHNRGRGGKENKYRGLDYNLLKIIKLNAKMPQAPYRWKYHQNRFRGVFFEEFTGDERKEQPDKDPPEQDPFPLLSMRNEQVREFIQSGLLSPEEIQGFSHYFYGRYKTDIQQYKPIKNRTIFYLKAIKKMKQQAATDSVTEPITQAILRLSRSQRFVATLIYLHGLRAPDLQAAGLTCCKDLINPTKQRLKMLTSKIIDNERIN